MRRSPLGAASPPLSSSPRLFSPPILAEYRDSIVADTLYYMDPEYQRTGTVRPKSDLYAFGIIALQLLAVHHPNGLLLKVENAITNGSFSDILDKSIPDWPFAEAEELAQMALKCSRLRCRERPDLETEVLPLLKKLTDIADANLRVGRHSIHAPSHYFCPILQVKSLISLMLHLFRRKTFFDKYFCIFWCLVRRQQWSPYIPRE
ncbi:hypothetical protein U1Q18_006027 [Sarracenia purpurea var. burkii]